jgi:hypothetical protein
MVEEIFITTYTRSLDGNSKLNTQFALAAKATIIEIIPRQTAK